MKLDLGEVLSHPGKRTEYIVDEPPLVDRDSGLKCVSPVKGKLTFTNSGSLLIVRGYADTAIELECSRCVGSFVRDVHVDIDEQFQMPGHEFVAPGEEEEDLFLDDESNPILSENIFDLTELLRQAILVEVPISTVCSDECKGLCATCGRNLNEESCKCPPPTMESAFSVLAGMLETKEKKKRTSP